MSISPLLGIPLLCVSVLGLIFLTFIMIFFRGTVTRIASFAIMPLIYALMGFTLGVLVIGGGSFVGASLVAFRQPTDPNTLPSSPITGIAWYALGGLILPIGLICSIAFAIAWYASLNFTPEPIFDNPLSPFRTIIGETRPPYGCGCVALPLFVLLIGAPIGGGIYGYGLSQGVFYDPKTISEPVGVVGGLIFAAIGFIFAIKRAIDSDDDRFGNSINLTAIIFAIAFGITALFNASSVLAMFGHTADTTIMIWTVIGSLILGALTGYFIALASPRYW